MVVDQTKKGRFGIGLWQGFILIIVVIEIVCTKIEGTC